MSLLGRIIGIRSSKESLGRKQLRVLKSQEEKLQILDCLGELTNEAIKPYEKTINEYRNFGCDTENPEIKLRGYKARVKR